MATYKKRGYKKSIAPGTEKQVEVESTTAEVFEKLDSTKDFDLKETKNMKDLSVN